jgi:hypothetical protein
VRVFKNRILRRLFGLRREEVTGGWRRLQDEKIYKLYLQQILLG